MPLWCTFNYLLKLATPPTTATAKEKRYSLLHRPLVYVRLLIPLLPQDIEHVHAKNMHALDDQQQHVQCSCAARE